MCFKRHSLVTGGAGFIGSHLVETLLNSGDHVTILDDFSTGRLENLAEVASHPRLQVIRGDVRDDIRMRELINAADQVYHLAAVVGVRLIMEQPERCIEVNSEATRAILTRCTEWHKPLFLASTSEVYGKNASMPLAETSDCIYGPSNKARWIYAAGKGMDDYLALALCRKHGLPCVIGRFFNTVGPRQIGHYGMVIPRFVERALAGAPLPVHGDGQQIRAFGHVYDVTRGVLGLMSSRACLGKVFNLGGDEPTSILDLARRILRLTDSSSPIEHVSHETVYGDGFEDIRTRIPDLSRIRDTLSYRPLHDLDKILSDCIAWKKQERHRAATQPGDSRITASTVGSNPIAEVIAAETAI